MHERERPSRREQISGPQHIGCPLGPLAVKPAELPRTTQCAAGPEHCYGLGKALAVATEPLQAQEHPAPDRACT